MQDVAQALEQTLDLPSILPHGARVDPTTDGFLLWLPSSVSLPFAISQTTLLPALIKCSVYRTLCCIFCNIDSESDGGAIHLPSYARHQLDTNSAHGRMRIPGHQSCSEVQAASW